MHNRGDVWEGYPPALHTIYKYIKQSIVAHILYYKDARQDALLIITTHGKQRQDEKPKVYQAKQ